MNKTIIKDKAEKHTNSLNKALSKYKEEAGEKYE